MVEYLIVIVIKHLNFMKANLFEGKLEAKINSAFNSKLIKGNFLLIKVTSKLTYSIIIVIEFFITKIISI